MSKEKQCECCHEWWYDSDVKENLCPNCYDYFKQLKQQLEEKDKLLKCYQEEEKLIADILGDKDLTIIGSRVHLKNLIVELKNKIKDKDIVIEEKDKEIDKQRQIINTIQQNIRQYSKEDYEDKQQLYEDIEMLKQNQKQFAISELEKVKEKIDCEMAIREYDISEQTADVCVSIAEQINQQIKELKGE